MVDTGHASHIHQGNAPPMLSSTLPPQAAGVGPSLNSTSLKSPLADPPHVSPGERSMPEIKTRLHWLMGLRVVVVTVMLGLSLAFQSDIGECTHNAVSTPLDPRQDTYVCSGKL